MGRRDLGAGNYLTRAWRTSQRSHARRSAGFLRRTTTLPRSAAVSTAEQRTRSFPRSRQPTVLTTGLACVEKDQGTTRFLFVGFAGKIPGLQRLADAIFIFELEIVNLQQSGKRISNFVPSPVVQPGQDQIGFGQNQIVNRKRTAKCRVILESPSDCYTIAMDSLIQSCRMRYRQ